MNLETYRRVLTGESLTAVLSPRALWRLTGPDAARYLNGQVTNDIVSLGPGDGCYAAFLTHKGKMLGDLRVLVAPAASSTSPVRGPMSDSRPRCSVRLCS